MAGSAVLDEVTADELAVELIMPLAVLCAPADDPIPDVGAGDNAFGGCEAELAVAELEICGFISVFCCRGAGDDELDIFCCPENGGMEFGLLKLEGSSANGSWQLILSELLFIMPGTALAPIFW